MASKRRRGIRSSSIEEIDTDGDVDSSNEELSEPEEDFYHISNDESMGSDDSLSGDDIIFQRQLYQKTVKDLKKMKDLKRRLKLSLMHVTKKPKHMKTTKDAFTRFSVTTFSSVVDDLTPHQKDIIQSYGFGSLLHFDKCFVPNKFA